nr:reverse transcriptase domain-containing protein [Tanacetum cinerariifolium]
RIHAEEELQMIIDGLDRNNEMIPKHLHEYEQVAAKLSIGEKIKLINELIEEFVLMASKEERERFKRKGLRLEQESPKKMKTSKEVSQEDLKEMMQLVPVEEVYVKGIQVKHPIIIWEIYSEGQRNYWKIIRANPATRTNTITTTVIDAHLKALIEQGVNAALAARDVDRNTNGDDIYVLGTGVRRTERVTLECTYPDFMKCQPLNFKGTKGVVELTQWSENKMTDMYCPRVEMKKLEFKLWNLKVKGTDVIGYNQHFQELALLCVRMFPEESDKITRYVGGLPT